MIKLSKVKYNKNNPRVQRDEQLDKLMKSIKDFPKMMSLRPMVVDDEWVLLGGNMRKKALHKLGYKEIPEDWVKKASDFTEDQKKQFVIKDNISFGDWDFEALYDEDKWDVDKLSDWGLDLPDFEQKDDKEAEDDNFEVKDPQIIDVVLGDLVEFRCTDGRIHKLLCGSSTESESWEMLTDGYEIDLVVTDPPYNVAYVGKTKDALTIKNDELDGDSFRGFLLDFYTSLNQYVKPGGGWYVWHAATEGHNFIGAMIESGILIKQVLVWVKPAMVLGRQDYQWRHEPCLYGWKDGAAHNWFSDRKQTTVLEFDKPSRNAEHPTMKPIPLIGYQIKNSSKKGEVVADGFMGSGTTMVAAHQLGRVGIGCELDPKYCQVIIDRMINLKDGIEVFINGKSYSKTIPEKII